MGILKGIGDLITANEISNLTGGVEGGLAYLYAKDEIEKEIDKIEKEQKKQDKKIKKEQKKLLEENRKLKKENERLKKENIKESNNIIEEETELEYEVDFGDGNIVTMNQEQYDEFINSYNEVIDEINKL